MLATSAVQRMPGARGGPGIVAQVHVVGGVVEILQAGFEVDELGLQVQEVARVERAEATVSDVGQPELQRGFFYNMRFCGARLYSG